METRAWTGMPSTRLHSLVSLPGGSSPLLSLVQAVTGSRAVEQRVAMRLQRSPVYLRMRMNLCAKAAQPSFYPCLMRIGCTGQVLVNFL